MQLYETIYIVKQDLDNKSLKDLEKKYENLLKLNKAIIEYKENWGLRNLAYKIQNYKKGYYYMINCECDSKIFKEFDIRVKQDLSFLRFLNIRLKSEKLTSNSSLVLSFSNS